MNTIIKATIISAPTILLTACGGGSSSGVASVPVAAFSPVKTSFDGSGVAPTSSSGKNLTSTLLQLDNVFHGAIMPYVSINRITSQLSETALEVIPKGTSMSSSASLATQVRMEINGNRTQGTMSERGEYGAYFESDRSSTNEFLNTDGRQGYIGILTDANDNPTAGEATYTGFSWADYQNRETSNTRTFYGLTSSTFVADFSNNMISGSSTGNLLKSGDTSTTIPVSITYDPTSIELSRFQGSGTAIIDGKTIAMTSRGAFFGPQAVEMGFVAGNTTNGDISMLNDGYLFKQ